MADVMIQERRAAMRKARKAKRSSGRPSFAAVDRFRLKDSGLIVTIELDQDTEDFTHLIGRKIVIDGKMETCFSVERIPHPPPWKKGDRVGLLIRKGA